MVVITSVIPIILIGDSLNITILITMAASIPKGIGVHGYVIIRKVLKHVLRPCIGNKRSKQRRARYT